MRLNAVIAPSALIGDLCCLDGHSGSWIRVSHGNPSLRAAQQETTGAGPWRRWRTGWRGWLGGRDEEGVLRGSRVRQRDKR